MTLRGKVFFVCIALILVVINPASVFAQTADCSDTTICWSPPKEFTLMMDFAIEMITAIKTMGTEGDYLGKPVNPNRFEGDTFKPLQQNIKTRASRLLEQTLSFMTATTAIFTSPQQWGGVQDLLAGIMILFKNKVFARDLQAVERIDSALSQKKYELGMWWWRTAKVNDANIQVFQSILTKYKNAWLFTEVKISQGVTYSAIAGFLGSMLMAIKSYLSLNTTNLFTAVQSFHYSNIRVTFDEALLAYMDAQYACVRGPEHVCSTTYKEFKKNMQKIWSWTVKETKAAMEQFSDAAKRLVEVFSKNPSSSFQSREQQLLKSYYGSTKIRSGNSLVSATIENGWIFSQWREAALQDKLGNTSQIDQTRSQEVTPYVVNTKSITSLIHDDMLQLLDDQDRDLESANFSDVSDFSAYFDGLGQQIAIVLNILWNKDSNGSLIKELGTACELQCENVSKVCR